MNQGNYSQYGGAFYWDGGSSNITYAYPPLSPGFAPLASRYFGFSVVCKNSPCISNQGGATVTVSQIALYVSETTVPTLNSPSGLWQTSGWVRGSWPVSVSADSPSGVCSLSASLNGLVAARSDASPDVSQWHQCAAAPINQTIDTSRYGQGSVPMTLIAVDAAGEPALTVEPINIDNQQPTVALSGPADVPSTAGTQYVTATASAGPSGVAGISCSVDNAPGQWYSGSSAQVPVGGLGEHTVQCQSENNAVDPNGARGMSDPESFSMKIGEPTVAAVAFTEVVNKLRCRRVTKRVRVPGHWVKVRRHGALVRVYRNAHDRLERVTSCHPRTVVRRVTRVVTIRRRGKTMQVRRRISVRVVLEPQTVLATSERVGHGEAATVYGWLGTDTGVALGGQMVDVLTAPDNGSDDYQVAAVVPTEANGGWIARLPGGPSRLVSASYAGAPDTEGSLAAPVHLIVPAKVQLLKVSPRRVPWGGVVHLTGRLEGGYLPPDGALVRLRIGEGSAVTTYGVSEHVQGNGQFTTTYRFGAGEASAHRTFWFQMASLPMGNYPYAPADSQRIYVDVGGHPPSRRARLLPLRTFPK